MLALLGFILGVNTMLAQINFEGSKDYGRIYDLTYNLNTEGEIYAATLGNHIMRSTDNGVSWDVFFTVPQGGSIRALDNYGDNMLQFYVRNANSADANTVYLLDIATQTIAKQYTMPFIPGANLTWVNSVSIFEADSDIVLLNYHHKVGTEVFAEVYYTTDGGSNWSLEYESIADNGISVHNVAINPGNSDHLFIARAGGPNNIEGGLLTSTDGGATWVEKIAGQVLDPIAFDPTNSDIMYTGTSTGFNTTVQNLYRSTDGGATWAIVPISWDTFFLDSINYIAIDPTNSDKVIVLEGNEIAISTDGGATWQNTIYPDDPNSYFYGLKAAYNPFNTQEVFINSDYYPLKSVDGGNTIERLENPFFYSRKLGVFTGNDTHTYYEVQRGLVHVNQTTLEETHMYVEPINFVFSDEGPLYFIDKHNEGKIYMFTQGFTGSVLWVSNEHGQNVAPLLNVFFDIVISVETDPNNASIAWVSLRDGGLKRIDYTDINSPITTDIVGPTSNYNFATFIDPADSNLIRAAFGGELYTSTDAGATWQNTSSGLTLDPAADFIFEIQQNPNNSDEFLLATTQGVFASTDAGTTWTQSLAALNVRKVEYSTINEGHIVASVHSALNVDAQLHFTMDNGSSWEAVPFEEIENIQTYSSDYIFHEESVTVYFSTTDLGIVTYELETVELGVENPIATTNGVSVYPNPTQNVFNVKSTQEEISKIEVYTVTGQKVIEQSGDTSVSLAGLNSGLYIVYVRTETQTIVKRVLKQ